MELEFNEDRANEVRMMNISELKEQVIRLTYAVRRIELYLDALSRPLEQVAYLSAGYRQSD